MKNTILALAAVGALIAPSLASAQSSTVTVNSTATILAYLDVTKVSDVDFGNVNPGAAARLEPGTAPGQGTLGLVQIDHNAEVNVSVALPAGGLVLAGGSGAEPKLPVDFSCGYSTVQAGALDGSTMPCSAISNRIGNGDGTTRTSFIQVGGDISSINTTDRIPGTYTGALVFTVTAIY